MTKYQWLIDQRNYCIVLAKAAKDNLIKQFYMKCARGYKIKAERLTLKEVGYGSCN